MNEQPTDGGRAARERAAREFVSGDGGRQLLRTVASHVTWLAWVTPGTGGTRLVRNGSCFVVRTPGSLFAVTAKHVVEGFVEARRTSNRIAAFIGNLELDLAARVIDAGRSVDIATVRLDESELPAIGKPPISVWPPVSPVEGQGILVAGYPGGETIATDRENYSFGLYHGIGAARRVSDRQITCLIDPSRMVDTLGLGLPPANYETGGLSGGPVLTLLRAIDPIVWALGGVISEGNSNLELITAERADVIQADGRVAA